MIHLKTRLVYLSSYFMKNFLQHHSKKGNSKRERKKQNECQNQFFLLWDSVLFLPFPFRIRPIIFACSLYDTAESFSWNNYLSRLGEYFSESYMFTRLNVEITSISFNVSFKWSKGRYYNKELLLLASLALSVRGAAVSACCNASKTITLLRYHKDLSWLFHILIKIF